MENLDRLITQFSNMKDLCNGFFELLKENENLKNELSKYKLIKESSIEVSRNTINQYRNKKHKRLEDFPEAKAKGRNTKIKNEYVFDKGHWYLIITCSNKKTCHIQIPEDKLEEVKKYRWQYCCKRKGTKHEYHMVYYTVKTNDSWSQRQIGPYLYNGEEKKLIKISYEHHLAFKIEE